MSRRSAVSLVCVSNNAQVLDTCLRASVEAGRALAPHTEFIVVENSAGDFATAGAALNHGACSARNPVIAFVHQDVYLHDLTALEAAAGSLLDTPELGMLGAVGIDRSDRIIGRIRDRILQLGEPAAAPRDVEAMDEVLFLLRRDDVLADPLAEDARLGWHAYAVEYSARVRSRGLRAAVVDIPLTHNSLTTNLVGLEGAHAFVGAAYPELLPLHTTCGTIGAPQAVGLWRRMRGWLVESAMAQRIGRATGGAPVVLADIRFLVDEAARLAAATSLVALDFAPATDVVGLSRLGRKFSAASTDVARARAAIDHRPEGELVVVSHLDPTSASALVRGLDAPWVLGHNGQTGTWLLAGAAPGLLAQLWPRRRNRPLPGALVLG